jgi:hypothetical protein
VTGSYGMSARDRSCGDVDETGPGRPVRAMWKASWSALRDVGRVLDHEGVLDARHRDADDVGLLEAVGAQQVGAHLARDEHGRAESIIASTIGVTRFVAPGPDVAKQTPTLPVAFA